MKMLMKINSPPRHFYLLSKSFTRFEISASDKMPNAQPKNILKNGMLKLLLCMAASCWEGINTYHYTDTSLLNCQSEGRKKSHYWSAEAIYNQLSSLHSNNKKIKIKQQQKTPASQHSKARGKAEMTGFRNRKMQL